MTDVLFYHLTGQPLEAALPQLLAKTLERGWRAHVQVGSIERLSALDGALWTYHDASFLPHGTAADDAASRMPIVLSERADRVNGASVLFAVDGVTIADQAAAGWERIVLMFDGGDEDALQRARADWKALKAAGVAATYWQQDDGRWVKKG
jgi:DNA polymerase-3 subunit chi